MEGVIILLSIGLTVIYIILFIKVWNMTSNVKRITKQLNADDPIWSVRRALLLGDKELAKEKILEALVRELQDYCTKSNYKRTIEQTKKYYGQALQDLGADLPEPIKNLKTMDDILGIAKFE